MRRTLAALVTGIVIGVALMWGGLVIAGGYWEYRVPGDGQSLREMVNAERWEPFEVNNLTFLRRPRFRP